MVGPSLVGFGPGYLLGTLHTELILSLGTLAADTTHTITMLAELLDSLEV